MYMYKVYIIYKIQVQIFIEKMVFVQNFDKIGVILYLEKEVFVFSVLGCYVYCQERFYIGFKFDICIV